MHALMWYTACTTSLFTQPLLKLTVGAQCTLHRDLYLHNIIKYQCMVIRYTEPVSNEHNILLSAATAAVFLGQLPWHRHFNQIYYN